MDESQKDSLINLIESIVFDIDDFPTNKVNKIKYWLRNKELL